ncbi:MAG: ChaN family lipoprotein [Desulfobacterales bacterium]|nr:ChaN family lipoprotein [Desulfobacterales bacterium]
MKHLLRFLVWSLAVLALVSGCRAMIPAPETLRLYDLAAGREVADQAALARLAPARIVLVGEHHTEQAHHLAQLAVIQALHRSGRKVAIGLEMFRKDAQAELDRWVAGGLDEAAFRPIYLDNWNFDWPLYRPIFDYARQNRLPMVGLNVPREVTRQVAREGFDSLSESQKGALGEISCEVTPQYREFVREAYGFHPHGRMTFDHFCQAQLLWDTAMALHATQYLDQHPDTVMVLLAGAGHVHKLGIPAQLDKLGAVPHVVIMPQLSEAPGPDGVTIEEADYLIFSEF